jgi:hypothetical protein
MLRRVGRSQVNVTDTVLGFSPSFDKAEFLKWWEGTLTFQRLQENSEDKEFFEYSSNLAMTAYDAAVIAIARKIREEELENGSSKR